MRFPNKSGMTYVHCRVSFCIDVSGLFRFYAYEAYTHTSEQRLSSRFACLRATYIFKPVPPSATKEGGPRSEAEWWGRSAAEAV